ncbi:hypothetical protein CAXC1_180002 [Candidatus Xenohaliotis californiensis]|uniref:Uncharacterized protein n=1 Tax=Candidatus Xenohaliotis californiensis TaxID=84677 RepID=A0ABM9N7D7_9RICK|nr:hypothetical protein CAXC1_180002 [Candidatus Xenohaliotis californiensis]
MQPVIRNKIFNSSDMIIELLFSKIYYIIEYNNLIITKIIDLCSERAKNIATKKETKKTAAKKKWT